jgi:hypothetical protein
MVTDSDEVPFSYSCTGCGEQLSVKCSILTLLRNVRYYEVVRTDLQY